MEIHRCPECMIDLTDENFCWTFPGIESIETSVLTHTCPDCKGVWFDAGEVHAVWKQICEQLLARSQ
jgi:Zn-finger nucleic acid-binding protein